MKASLKIGFSFGFTSGIITTLGLIVGLYSSTGSKAAVLGGILTIAIADAFSDALGIHISQESVGTHSKREVWEATIATFLTKFLFALSFALPIAFLSLSVAVIANIVWGVLLLTTYSYYLAKQQQEKPRQIIAEHLSISLAVVALTLAVGKLLANIFN